MPPENLSAFFRAITNKDGSNNFINSNAHAEDRCTRTAKLLASAVESSLSELHFQPEEKGWLIPRCTSHLTHAQQAACKLYVAETKAHRIEVLDRAPHVWMSNKKTGGCFKIDRIIAVQHFSETVLIKTTPNGDPQIQLHKDEKFMPYKDVMMHMNAYSVAITFQMADIVMEKINAALPLPEWAVNFDRDYQISGRHVVRKPSP